MRPATTAILGIAAYLVFVAATIPARFVATRVQEASHGGLQLTDAAGTAWSGTARAVVSAAGGPLAIDRVEWRLRPARLLAGTIAFEVKAGRPGFESSAEVGRSTGAWHLRDLDARGDVAVLAAILPAIAAWRPEGTALITSPAFSWDGRDARGDLRIEWRGAGLALAQVRPIGTYRAEVHGEGGPATVKLTTLEGALRLAGQGTLSAGRFDFTGEARAEGADARALDPLLDLIGPRRADGSRALEWRTR